MRYLADSPIEDAQALSMSSDPTELDADNFVVSLRFQSGAIGTLQYFSNGSKAFPKERLELFSGNAVYQLDNFRRLKGYGARAFRDRRLLRQDKGHEAGISAFVESVLRGERSPIPWEEISEVSRVCVELDRALFGGSSRRLND